MPALCTHPTAGGPCLIVLEDDGTCMIHGDVTGPRFERNVFGEGAHAGPCCEYCRDFIRLRSLPVERRMEAMGMKKIAGAAELDDVFARGGWLFTEADRG